MKRSFRPYILVAVGLFSLCGWAAAQIGPAPDFRAQPLGSCAELQRQCDTMSDSELQARAFRGTNPETGLGMCYFHTRVGCPNCACEFYVKLSNLPFPSGYDGGTGCLFPPADMSDVLQLLREQCRAGNCCCPAPRAYPGPCLQVVVWARDPNTGTCCQYGTPCSAPVGWATYSSQIECELQ